MIIDEASKGKQICNCEDLRAAALQRQAVITAAFPKPTAAAFVLNMNFQTVNLHIEFGMWTFIKREVLKP